MSFFFIFFKLFTQQALKELGIGSIVDIKNFYLNDVINYHQQTYQKVSKLYEDFKARKLNEKKIERNGNTQLDIKTEGEIKVEEFMRENDL